MRPFKLFGTIITLSAALSFAAPIFACEDHHDCHHGHWRKSPKSVIEVENNAPVLAEINADSLSVWGEGGAELESTAIGALATIPAGSVKVKSTNNAPVDAIVNVRDATVVGPFKANATAIGAAAIGSEK